MISYLNHFPATSPRVLSQDEPVGPDDTPPAGPDNPDMPPPDPVQPYPPIEPPDVPPTIAT